MTQPGLIERLREQASASGHRWTDVMRLLLEAADALESNAKIIADGIRLGVIPQMREIGKEELALNAGHPDADKAADAFWQYWRENGETHKHGYYESTWGAINRALRVVGVVRHKYHESK